MKAYLLFLFLIAGTLAAQMPATKMKDNGIYLSDTDFIQKKLTRPFNNGVDVKFKEINKILIAIKTPDSTYKFIVDEIWGYRQNGSDWRVFAGQQYRVDHVGKICIYTMPRWAATDMADWSYFSQSLTSPIHEVSKKNLATIFYSDSTFVNKINSLPTTAPIFKWDKEKHRYQFINWLPE